MSGLIGKGQTALITGASGGIGLELARLLARDGFDLVLVARGATKLAALGAELEAVHGVNVRVLAADLARPEAPEEIAKALAAENRAVDVLVNNAGYGLFGRFDSETDKKEELEMIALNVTALTHLTKLFVPGMVARRRGRILNVASTAAFQPGPLMAVYYATKAYVLSFSEAIANELAEKGVSVTALCPGPTSTGFQEKARMQDSKLVKGRVIMDAATVARIGYDGLMRGKTVVIPGWKNALLVQSVRVSPRKVVTALVRALQERG